MPGVNRRQFLGTLGAACVVPSVLVPQSARTAKNWTWLRSNTKDVDVWRRMLAGLKRTGFDAVLIGGTAEFYRTHVPLARDEGLELHAWQPVMMRGENVKAHPDWYAVSGTGVSTAIKPPYVDYYKFMCPSREEVRAYLRGIVREITSVEGIGSFHLDYIRFPDVILPVALWPKYNLVQDREYPQFDYCYCGVCQARFKSLAGVYRQLASREKARNATDFAWKQFRYDAITQVVRELYEEAHTQGKAVTAAVFPTPEIAKKLVRQDWVKWKLDAVLPMIYNGFYKEDVPWVERATREGVTALAGRIPLYSGLYVPDLPPADLAKAIDRAFAGGASGISVFQGDMLTPEYLSMIGPVLKAHRTLR